MAITGIDHVVIRVNDLDIAIESYKNLGMELERTLETPAIGKQAIFRLADGTFIELIAPLSPESAIGRALESRGEGVHTVCFATEEFDKTVETLKETSARVIEDPALDGVAFIHPKSTHGVLLQLSRTKS